MIKFSRKNLFVFLFFCTLFISLICLGLGSIKIQPSTTYKILINEIFNNYYPKNWEATQEIIILGIRLPRIILAFITGASMSIIGVLMQTLTKNYLAEPYILGISSGSSAGAVSVIILNTTIPFFRYFTVSQGAFIGALISICIVFLINFTNASFSSQNLVLIGVGVSSFFSALTTFIIYSSTNNSQVISAMFWITGSLSSATREIILYPTVISIIVLFISVLFSTELDIFLLGENMAKSLGLNTNFLKIMIIIISTLLVSTIVSLTGIIGFVGLIIPHIARKIVGYKHSILLPFSFIFGGNFLVLADTFARTIFAPEELPIGVLTAFVGAPIFLFIIKKSTVGDRK